MRICLFKKGLVIGIFTIVVILCIPISSIGYSLNNEKITRESNYKFSSGKNNFYGVSFTDIETGTVVGDNGIIYHTEDGGDTWNRQFILKNFQQCTLDSRLYDVSFFNEDIGMAVGLDGTVIYTINGGEKWNVAKSGDNVMFYGSQMLTSSIGFSAGENTIFQPMILRTNDCWQTFDTIIFYPEHGGSDYEAELTDIFFIDNLTGFTTARIYNGEGAICQSNDSGYNWDTVYWTDYYLNDISFPSDTYGYAVGNFGKIFKTIDQGENWIKLNSGTNKDLYSASFPTEEIGNAVGENGVIIRTEDAGSSWLTQKSGTTKNLREVQFLDAENGFAVGDEGIILRTDDGGDSWDLITKNSNKQSDIQQYIKFYCFRFIKLLSDTNWSLFSLL